MIGKKSFGFLPDGREVIIYTIRNAKGAKVELLNYGAAVNGLYVQDAGGVFGNVVLGAAKAADLAERNYSGVTIGRVANRIANGRFILNGRTVNLERNRGGHFVHGASGNYAKRIFNVTEENKNTLLFTLTDEGQGGFGNKVEVSVRFMFDDNQRLSIRYLLKPEEDTIVSPTNHSYFNLNGGGEITDHTLQVYAGSYAVKGDLGMPQGKSAFVEGTPLDFRAGRKLGIALNSGTEAFFGTCPSKIDDTFLLQKKGFGLSAELFSPKSGRWMCVYTDMPAMVVFTPFENGNKPGTDGEIYHGYCGIALETQFVPNAINCPVYEAPIVRAGEEFISETVYAFGADKS